MALFQTRQRTIHLPGFVPGPETGQVEGTGREGGAAVATFSLALAAGASFYEAARLANYATGLAEGKDGSTVLTEQELIDAVEADHDASRESWSQEGVAQGRIRMRAGT